MTRESKVGLAVASSFIGLVAIVVATKFHANDAEPPTAQVVTPGDDASPVIDKETPKSEGEHKKHKHEKKSESGVAQAGLQIPGEQRPDAPPGPVFPPNEPPPAFPPSDFDAKDKKIKNDLEREVKNSRPPSAVLSDPSAPVPAVPGGIGALDVGSNNGPPTGPAPFTPPPSGPPMPPPPDSPGQLPNPFGGAQPPGALQIPVDQKPPPSPVPAVTPKDPAFPPTPDRDPLTPPVPAKDPPPPADPLPPPAIPGRAPAPPAPPAGDPLPPPSIPKDPPNVPVTPPPLPVPKIAAPQPKSTDIPPVPLGADPPPLGPTVGLAPPVANNAPKVKSFDVQPYVLKPGDASFEAISKQVYGDQSGRYSQALLQFNREYPNADIAVRQNPPILKPGQKVFIPSIDFLEQHYASAIGATTPPIAAGSGGMPAGTTIPGSKPIVPPVIGPKDPPRVGPAVGTQPVQPPTSDAFKLYRVPDQGQHILEIAQRTLGDRGRWNEIYRLNPNISPQFPIPGGTQLRLPASAVVP